MKVSEDNKIKVAIAGLGRSGYHIHASVLKYSDDKYKIVSVADELSDRLESAQKEFEVNTFTDYNSMLSAGGFDLFVNALPSHLHVQATTTALELGNHVVSEKPMAFDTAEFDRLVEISEKCGKILAPFQNNKYQPFFTEILDILNTGLLGEILEVRSVWGSFSRRWDWQTYQCNGGGCLFNSGPHAIDQALHFFPFDVKPKVESTLLCRNELGGDADDYCCIVLKAPNCPRVEITISQYIAYRPGDIYTISGTRGGLTGNYKSLSWKYYEWQKAAPQPTWKPWSIERKYPSEELPWIEKEWKLDVEKAGKYSGYTLRSFLIGAKYIYDALYNTIKNGTPLASTLPEVRRQIEILEECKRQNPLPKRLNTWLT
ncbi:MAG TPA: Gfo/Idh/MocA family oxidoreductase [Saprospiraceae bacterium]|mgnify:CR=1 FL=1|nr:Gfo/Idh/MocA family oxidoreductase [Saprospiraceae bacterium]